MIELVEVEEVVYPVLSAVRDAYRVRCVGAVLSGSRLVIVQFLPDGDYIELY